MIKLLWLSDLGCLPSGIKIAKGLQCHIVHIDVHFLYIPCKQCLNKIIIIALCSCKPSSHHSIKHIHDFPIRQGKLIHTRFSCLFLLKAYHL